MAAAKGVRIIGMEETQSILKDVMPREARNILRRTVVNVAKPVRDTIRQRAPKRTRNLERSIKSRRQDGRRRDQIGAAVYVDRSGGRTGRGYHWHLVEFGTVKMAAQPFVVPTVEEFRPRIPAIYREEFGVQFTREMAKRHKKR